MRLPANHRRGRIRSLQGVLAGLLSASLLAAQEPTPTPASAHALKVTTRLVIVDVVVVDKHGHKVADLKREDFTVFERGRPQKIAVFSTERASEPSPTIPPAPLPPRVYTNRTEYRQPGGPPVILLLDILNTNAGDQSFARQQLLRYIRTQLRPDQHTAVLALSDSLLLLQDFTDDPRLLLAALEKFSPQKSVELARGQPRTVTPVETQAMAGTNLLQTIDRLNQSAAIESIERRAQITLQALRAIARALGGFRGRKNLIWVSSVFPINFQSLKADDPSLSPAATPQRMFSGQRCSLPTHRWRSTRWMHVAWWWEKYSARPLRNWWRRWRGPATSGARYGANPRLRKRDGLACGNE